MDIEQLKTEIINIRFYHLESLRALAGIAAEIRGIKDADTRKELTRRFEAQHGRKVAVWARINKRFGDVMQEIKTVDGFLALAYACQLPDEASRDLIAAHSHHLDEPLVHLLVLRDVNEHTPQRGARGASLAARIADIYRKDVHDGHWGMFGLDVISQPEIARELKREAEAKQ